MLSSLASRAPHRSKRKIRLGVDVEAIAFSAQQTIAASHRDHCGVVGAVPERRRDDAPIPGLQSLRKALAQARISCDAAGQHDGVGAGLIGRRDRGPNQHVDHRFLKTGREILARGSAPRLTCKKSCNCGLYATETEIHRAALEMGAPDFHRLAISTFRYV